MYIPKEVDNEFLNGKITDVIERLQKLVDEHGTDNIFIDVETEDIGFYQPHHVIRIELAIPKENM